MGAGGRGLSQQLDFTAFAWAPGAAAPQTWETEASEEASPELLSQVCGDSRHLRLPAELFLPGSGTRGAETAGAEVAVLTRQLLSAQLALVCRAESQLLQRLGW